MRRSVVGRLTTLCAAVGVTLALLSTPPWGLGTVNTLGQHAEHEIITRVLQCNASTPVATCFQPGSMSMLAALWPAWWAGPVAGRARGRPPSPGLC